MENKQAKKFWEKLFLAQQSNCCCGPASFYKNIEKKNNSENLDVENKKRKKRNKSILNSVAVAKLYPCQTLKEGHNLK